jgi:hypothetical protein
MCAMTAYLEKIDYCHTRLSIPLDFALTNGSYVSTTLKKIIVTGEFKPPINSNLFDIVSVVDVANALRLVGCFGKNKVNYYIGTGMAARLDEFFEFFKRVVYAPYSNKTRFIPNQSSYSCYFDAAPIGQDIGFYASRNFEDLAYSFAVQ